MKTVLLALIPCLVFASDLPSRQEAAKKLKEYLQREKGGFEQRETQKKDLLEELDRLNAQQNSVREKMLQMTVNKQEMTHPHKHIIIRDNVPYLIDFERCRYTEDPKNITQFLQFITSMQVTLHLEKKGIHLNKEIFQKLAKRYKEERSKKVFDEIKKEIPEVACLDRKSVV